MKSFEKENIFTYINYFFKFTEYIKKYFSRHSKDKDEPNITLDEDEKNEY